MTKDFTPWSDPQTVQSTCIYKIHNSYFTSKAENIFDFWSFFFQLDTFFQPSTSKADITADKIESSDDIMRTLLVHEKKSVAATPAASALAGSDKGSSSDSDEEMAKPSTSSMGKYLILFVLIWQIRRHVLLVTLTEIFELFEVTHRYKMNYRYNP